MTSAMKNLLKTTGAKTLYLVAGRTCSGKSTLVSFLAEKLGLKVVKSYTTRPMRPGEEVKADHIFIKKEEVDRFRDQMAAYTKIGEYEYFTTWDVLEGSDIYIIDPEGIQSLKKKVEETGKNIRFQTIYITAPDEIRRQRAEVRGDKSSVVKARMEAEDAEFTAFEKATEDDSETVWIENTVFQDAVQNMWEVICYACR